MRLILMLFFVGAGFILQAQPLYFPPANSDWSTLSTDSLNWCPEKIETLDSFLEANNTKSFMLLQDGKIVLEHYFNGHTANSPWYWASAGKTLTAMLVGIAQEEGVLNIEDPVSDYLGLGWSVAPPDTEALITIRHLLTMTSGFDDTPTIDGVTYSGNDECLSPECLQF